MECVRRSVVQMFHVLLIACLSPVWITKRETQKRISSVIIITGEKKSKPLDEHLTYLPYILKGNL